ncbi:hypothetical protein PLICRDRAFT_45603 [Plicaturopsis crispa FD-325 SS-3]|uniref:Unplaced genomic scaffold PLICRscaffold_16, whole genome shotgun sequence n=1 Tax=Plicaturopsis crispa FD-325 SS-3 TaxID=944288 RepID=A0A0C9SL35_PLICR|nr:hypothetical protein PLICRDRAFT_45603 [Plicaturopsis crispa FD-325 SS-3]
MSVRNGARTLLKAFKAGVGRLDKSFKPSDTIERLAKHKWVWSDSIYIFHILLATFWITIMEDPGFPLKLGIPILYTIALLVPFTSQFFLPASPIFAWVLTFYSSRFIPAVYRPSISVALLPTLETVLYGANISDILTRFTHPVLDIIAWLPYGLIHFTCPFVIGAFTWLFRPKEALHLWARMFGYMNLVGVFVQILFPCAAPWYELIYGLTPANYSMPGSAGGLARIDALFHSHGYHTAFSNSPVVFGAFPSLHAGSATMEALFVSHFFPQMTRYVYAYAGVLYWATMYLTHHYLVDVVAGACLSVAVFYLLLPDNLRGANATAPPGGLSSGRGGSQRSKYEVYDLEAPRSRGGRRSSALADAADFDLASESSDEEVDITYRSPVPGATPTSAAPFVQQQQQAARAGGHRHTASIASLIRADERAEDGWSPITGGFSFPPTPTRTEREGEDRR